MLIANWPLADLNGRDHASFLSSLLLSRYQSFFSLCSSLAGSVADLEGLYRSWIRFLPFWIQGQIDQGSTSKNLYISTPKIVYRLSEICSGMFIPDPDPDTGDKYSFTNVSANFRKYSQ
jgi:hypothetical protein